MEGMLCSDDQQRLVSSFLEIAVGQTSETARQFLQATNWKLEEAIQRFNTKKNKSLLLPPVTHTEPMSNDNVAAQSSSGAMTVGNSQHQPTCLIDEGAFSPSASASPPNDILASLYPTPFHLMFHGSYQLAKATSFSQDKWLLVNLQSHMECSSLMLNRDVWANEVVSQVIKANFIFLQVYDDTTVGRSFCKFYKVKSIPLVLLINPTTGQVMKTWCEKVELIPEVLIVDLLPFMDYGPRKHFAASLSKKQPKPKG
ncbi:Plant UBX domain-containing protein 7 [Cardamine amara subsp. amara]|uniref:Plant UBX domain-containing protein 7 n=1 Tax=Cardamine amara subsp. amara TaxID=228776 RepID=A0ABD1AS72_CARAN